MTEVERSVAIVVLTLEAIGRTGATEADLGYDPGDQHRWWASARYGGETVTCDGQPDPESAVLGLYGMLAAGGICTSCYRAVAIASDVGLALGCGTAGTRPSEPRTTRTRRRTASAGWSPPAGPAAAEPMSHPRATLREPRN